MSGARHTPGPWRVIDRSIPWSLPDGQKGVYDERWIYTAWEDPQGKRSLPVVTRSTVMNASGELAAYIVGISAENASLIAAAPELLDALDVAERFMSGFEGDSMQVGIGGHLKQIRAAIAKATGGQQ